MAARSARASARRYFSSHHSSRIVQRRRQRRKQLRHFESLEERIVLATDLPLFGELPLGFEPNVGQVAGEFDFQARGGQYQIGLSSHRVTLALSQSRSPQLRDTLPVDPETYEPLPSEAEDPLVVQSGIVGLELVGARSGSSGTGLDAQSRVTHYLVGNDPSQWFTDIANFGKVRYDEIYNGIDVVYYGNQQNLQFDFVLDPGANPSQIVMHFDGADQVTVDGQGNLRVHVDDQFVLQHAPHIYQWIDGQQVTVSGGYRLLDDSQVAFDIGNYDTSRTLVIDPVLSYSTLIGGNSTDQGFGVAVDGAGNAYVVGLTNSSNFTTTSGAFSTALNSSFDVFVTKLNANGTGAVYSTYLGGSGDDRGFGIAVDGSGNVYVTGMTSSTNFPTLNPVQSAHGGGTWDAFVSKLNASGSALVYSTYLGGSGPENSNGLHGYNSGLIAVDSAGRAWVTGMTDSTNFPGTTTANSAQPVAAANRDAFVARLNAAGTSLDYSSYLGGSGDDRSQGIALDSSGNAYLTGFTSSSNFPITAGVFQSSIAGSWDIFVSKIDPTKVGAASLSYSTYAGGSSDEYGQAIAVDGAGHAYFTGLANSASRRFPTVNAVQGDGAGSYDVFVSKLNPTGTAMVYSTFVGGPNDDRGQGIAVDADGNAHVTGFASGGVGLSSFPVVAPLYATHGGGFWDGIAFKLNASGNALHYSTYLPGNGDDRGQSIALDANKNAYIAGLTTSSNFPTTSGSFQPQSAGGWDVFALKIGDAAQHAPQLTPPANLAIAPEQQATLKPAILDSDLPVSQGSTIAYRIPEGTRGTQTSSSSLGMDFDVVAPVRITHLGVFDDGSDGLFRQLTARVYDRANPNAPLRSITFAIGSNPQTSGTLIGGSRYLPLAQPLDLPAGFRGTIVAENYGGQERNGNSLTAAGYGVTNTGGGHIAFVGSARFGTQGQFPTNTDTGPTNRYAAGTFMFEGLSANTVTFTLDQGPATASINSSTGEVTWTPDGNESAASFTVTATDAGGLSSSVSFTAHVAAPAQPPNLPPFDSGTALHFDGIDDFVEVPHSDSLHHDRQITISGWFQVDDFPTAWQNIFHKGNYPNCVQAGCSNREYALFIHESGSLHFTATSANLVDIGQTGPITGGNVVVPGRSWTRMHS
jgi:hypothetical protein